MATGRKPLFRRSPARRVRIAWRTWMPWYEPARLLGEAQDTADRAEGVLLPASGLVVVTAGLVLALPALALVWPVIGAGALLALLLAAPGDTDTVAGQGLLGGPDALALDGEDTSLTVSDMSIVEGKSVFKTHLSIVEEGREGTGYGNNDADDTDDRAGTVDVPRLPRAPERDDGVRGHDGRDGPPRMGGGLRHARVPARMVRRSPGGDKRAAVCVEEAGLTLTLGLAADSTGGWADE